MTLLSVYSRLGAAAALVAAFALAGCEDTANTGARNNGGAPVVSGAAASRVESPLPGDPSLEKAPASPSRPAPAPEDPVVSTPPAAQAPEIRLTPPESARNQVRVALLLPLTGPQRALGQALLDAATLAAFDVADADFVLLPIDTGGTADGAANAAAQAVGLDAKLAIGPVFSNSVSAAAPTLLAAGINMLAFSNNRDVAEPGVFIAGLLPETQIDRIVRHAAGIGLRRLGALVPAGPFGRRVLDALDIAAAASGVEVTRIQEFGASPDEIATAVRTIGDYDTRRQALLEQRKSLEGREDEGSKRALARLEILETIGPVPFDTLLVAVSGPDLVNVAAQLGNFDIDTKRVRVLGMADWAAEHTGREPSLVGARFASPPIEARRGFAQKFRGMFETVPPALATAAYDLVALAAILGSRPDGAAYDRATLTSDTGFAGVGGLFRFVPGGLSERSLEIREVLPRGNRLVEPARERFGVLTN